MRVIPTHRRHRSGVLLAPPVDDYPLHRAHARLRARAHQLAVHDDRVAFRDLVEQRDRALALRSVEPRASGRTCTSAASPPRRYCLTVLRAIPNSRAMRFR